jgi:CubicO group peptidase (beta-lactamase class C family)
MTTHRWSGVARIEVGGDAREYISGERRRGSPLSAGTRFQAGSVGKTVVAIVVLHLVEQRTLGLSVPIVEYLPELPRDKGALTLHNLLSHTAGLGHWPDLPDVDMADPPPAESLYRRVRDQPLDHPVGSWHYSNFGYLFAARIVAEVTGELYSTMAHRIVFGPAEMTDSSSGRFPGGDDDVAGGHHGGVQLTTSPTPTSIPGTGDLWTTARDLVRLSRALSSSLLLRPRSVDAMMTPHATFDTVPIGDPRVTAGAYGYGTWLGAVRGRRAAIQPGDNVGYRSLLAHAVEEDAHIAVLTNDDKPTLQQPLDLLWSERAG